MTVDFKCQGCGALIHKTWRGRPPKWCSERCRKDSYAGNCIDCGAKLSGCNGRGPNAPKRCVSCAAPVGAQTRTVWTREAVVLAMQEWAAEYGEHPATTDWNPTLARCLHDEARARRFEDADGRWPHHTTVHRTWGSWNAAVKAAGFEPRAGHGGGGNEQRKRSFKAAA